MNEYLSKSNQNSVHYLSASMCNMMLHILVSALAVCTKVLASEPMALSLAFPRRSGPWP